MSKTLKKLKTCWSPTTCRYVRTYVCMYVCMYRRGVGSHGNRLIVVQGPNDFAHTV